MKVKLIVPKWSEGNIWRNFVFRITYLSVTTIAALTPADVEVVISDENVSDINYEDSVDLVAITAITPLAPRAYEIADRFRAQGVKVVIGGVHATWMPDEAAGHADCVVMGEAEPVWAGLLEDLKNNRLKPLYKGLGMSSIESTPVPRRDLLSEDGYFFKNTIQTTRGCPFDCDFCSVTAFYGHTYRCRPLKDVEAELKTITGGANFVFFVDDNITGNLKHAKGVFELMKKFPHLKWVSQTSVLFAENEELLKLAAETRCHGMFIGFETLLQEGIKGINKNVNKVHKYVDVVKRLHDHGIGVLGSFIFGYDWDTPDSFDMVMEFAHKTRLDGSLFTILTPYPGTRVFERMKAEGRLISTDWSKYDMAHVVFKPKNMTPEELQEGYLRLNRRFYSYGSMLRRLPSLRRSITFFGAMNWGMRKAWRQFTY